MERLISQVYSPRMRRSWLRSHANQVCTAWLNLQCSLIDEAPTERQQVVMANPDTNSDMVIDTNVDTDTDTNTNTTVPLKKVDKGKGKAKAIDPKPTPKVC
jgi:hypothetical protein